MWRCAADSAEEPGDIRNCVPLQRKAEPANEDTVCRWVLQRIRCVGGCCRGYGVSVGAAGDRCVSGCCRGCGVSVGAAGAVSTGGYSDSLTASSVSSPLLLPV